MKKKLLILFLAMMMVFSALPTLVFSAAAEEPTAEAEKTPLDETKALTSLYAEGATVILVAYNAASDGSIVLNDDGTGTWLNLANNKTVTLNSMNETYVAGGVTKSTGWKLGDRSVGYDLARDAGTKDKTYIQLAGNASDVAALMATTNTVELVAARKTMDVVTSASNYGYSQLLQGANLHLRQNYTVQNGAVGLYELGIAYSANGGFSNQIGYMRDNGSLNGTAARMIFRSALSEDGTTVTVKYDTRTDGDSTVSGVIPAADDGRTKTTAVHSTNASTLRAFYDVPADIYAIRIYNRVLDESELLQNHFVDLVGYTGYAIDAARFAALPETAKSVAYDAAKDLTIESATVEALSAAAEKAYLVGEAITSDGVAVNTDGDAANALRTVYRVNLASIATLEAQGYTVTYGALLAVASHDGVTHKRVSDLTLGADGVVDVTVYASDSASDATYVYVSYESGVDATYALSVSYNDEDSARSAVYYATEFVYRGYLTLTDGEGNETVVYVDPSNTWYEGVGIKDLISLLPEKKAEKIESAQ